MAYIKSLMWESAFFYQRIGSVEFRSEGRDLPVDDLAQFDLVQAKVSTDRTDRLDKLVDLGFRIAQTEVSFAYEVKKSNKKYDYRVADRRDVPAVCTIAKDVFCLSRFRPPWFDEKDRARFYSVWAEKAIRGTFDSVCLLVEEKDDLIGFVTMRDNKNGSARIGLLARNITEHNHNSGLRLWKAAISWCMDRGISHLKVVTQLNNIAAIRLYMRTGARIDAAAYWLYWSKKVD